MAAGRRSSRLQASQQSAVSSQASPKKAASKRTRAARALASNAGSYNESDEPILKRRKTRNVSSRTAVDAGESAMSVAVEVSTTTTTSTVVSGATTPQGQASDTPATTVDSADERVDDVEEDRPRTRAATKSAKGKEKVIPPSDDDDESELSALEPSETECSEPESEYIKAPTRSRKGKARIVPASDGEDSDFTFEDDDSDNASFVAYEESDGEFDESGTSPVNPPVHTLPPPAPPPRPRAVAPRRRGVGTKSRADRDREGLYLHHPELRVVWKDYANRPRIEVKEDPQPEGLSLSLLPFQKEGLHWMREQEKTEFRGGILADEMGMGKTIQTIALLMADPQAMPNLVIAPTVAIMQWKHEIDKFTDGAFKVFIFHGNTKTSNVKELKKHHVVLTTYNLLESVYRKQVQGFKRKEGLVKEASTLHKIDWHRVILDEAHNIKDRTCNTAKAVFALKTTYKLCLSGTPLQNRIGELFSLLRFLEADPFAYYYCRKCACKELHWNFKDNRSCDKCKHPPMSHMCFFNYDCLKPIQRAGNQGEGRIAFQKIQTLMKHIMLRRTKQEREEDLGLPPKVVKIRRDRFSEEELDLYDSIYSDSKRKFDTYVAQGVILNNYANIFTLITRLRQMADHPDLCLRRHSEEGQNTLVCVICDDEAEDAIKSRCHHTFCRDCVQKYLNSYDGDLEPDCPRCHITLNIDLTQPGLEVDELTIKKKSIINRIDMSSWRSSTKIEALCEELWKLRSPHRTIKSIVFSQYTSMLQLVEWRLRRAGFKTVMLEGSMSPSQRDGVIRYFMDNVDVEVFLVSLKAGGIALNLIEANNVFIMDPWWNPSVEWQAQDRIHRIGQTRMCTVTRLIIQDSIESRIVELQEKKERMIHATVNADQKAMDRLTPGDMQFLFQN